MQSQRGWIFDLDGTLTLAQHDFAAIRRELGVPADEDILTHLAALPAVEQQAMRAQLDAIEMRLAREVEPAPGAAELIRHLHQSGLRIGILTRNLQQIAFSSLDVLGVRECFAPAHVLGRAEALPKPDPEGIARLLEQWALPPQQAIMVGDFRFDLEAGRAAGCQTCLVHPDNTWPALADWHVPDCRALLAQLRA